MMKNAAYWEFIWEDDDHKDHMESLLACLQDYSINLIFDKPSWYDIAPEKPTLACYTEDIFKALDLYRAKIEDSKSQDSWLDHIKLMVALIKLSIDRHRDCRLVIKNHDQSLVQPNELMITDWKPELKQLFFKMYVDATLRLRDSLKIETIPGDIGLYDLMAYEVDIFYLTSSKGFTGGSFVNPNDALAKLLKVIHQKTGVDYATLSPRFVLDEWMPKTWVTVSRQNPENLSIKSLEWINASDSSYWILKLSLSSDQIFKDLISGLHHYKTLCNTRKRWLSNQIGLIGIYVYDYRNAMITYQHTEHSETEYFDIKNLSSFKKIFTQFFTPDKRHSSEVCIPLGYLQFTQLMCLIELRASSKPAPLLWVNPRNNELVLYKKDTPDLDFSAFDDLMSLMQATHPDSETVCEGMRQAWSVPNLIDHALEKQRQGNYLFFYCFALACKDDAYSKHSKVHSQQWLCLFESVSNKSPYFQRVNADLLKLLEHEKNVSLEKKLIYAGRANQWGKVSILCSGLSLEDLKHTIDNLNKQVPLSDLDKSIFAQLNVQLQTFINYLQKPVAVYRDHNKSTFYQKPESPSNQGSKSNPLSMGKQRSYK